MEANIPTPPDDRWTDADEAQKNYAIAQSAAAYAHLAYLSSRWGILPSDGQHVVFYDSNPYADYPERRDKELAALVQAVSKRGIRMLARAEYPRRKNTRLGFYSTLERHQTLPRLSRPLGEESSWRHLLSQSRRRFKNPRLAAIVSHDDQRRESLMVGKGVADEIGIWQSRLTR